MEELTPGPDPFDMYSQTQRSRAFWRMGAVALGVVGLFLVGIIVALAIRPVTVAIPDLTTGQMRLVKAGNQDVVTRAYAKSFFVRMLKQRFGWNSMTVVNDMDDYLGHCYKTLREREEKALKEPIAMDPQKPNEKIPRLHAYLQANLRNDLILPDSLDQVECHNRDRLWYCDATFAVVTQGLLPPSAHKDEKTVRVKAHLVEVPFTKDSLDGLILTDMAEVEPGKTKSDT